MAPPSQVDRLRPQSSAESRTRWSTKVPTVQSLRSPASISAFSRKNKGIVLKDPPKELENNSRTTSTSTAGSSTDSEKEQVPPYLTRHPTKQKDRVPAPPPLPDERDNHASRDSERPRPEVREPPALRAFQGSELARSSYSSPPLSTPDSEFLARSALSPTTMSPPRPLTTRGRSSSRTPDANTRGRSDATHSSSNVSVHSASFGSAKHHHPAVRSSSRSSSRVRPAVYVERTPRGRSSRSRTPTPSSSGARGRAQIPISNVTLKNRSSSVPRKIVVSAGSNVT